MADRRREPNPKRTPSANPGDIRDLLRYEVGVGDFAPQMQGFVVPESALSAADPNNLITNSGFEDGTVGWESASGTLSSVSTPVTEGSFALKHFTAVSLAVNAVNSIILPTPGVGAGQYVHLEADVQTDLANATMQLIVQVYDKDGVHTGSVGGIRTYVPNDAAYHTLKADLLLPDFTELGFTTVGMVFGVVVLTAGGTAFASKTHYFDNVKMTVAPQLRGLLEGTIAPGSVIGEQAEYFPSATQLGDLGIQTSADWSLMGKQMTVWGFLTTTATGTANNSLIVTLPSATDSPNGYRPKLLTASVVGTSEIVGFGSGHYGGCDVRLFTVNGLTPSVTFARADINTVTAAMGVDPNIAIGNGATIRYCVTYPVW